MKVQDDEYALEIALGNLNLCRIVANLNTQDEDDYKNPEVIVED